MSKASKVRRKRDDEGADDLDEMRKAYNRSTKGTGGGGGGDSVFYKPVEGKNLLRFLPREGTQRFYVTSAMHFRIGDEQRPVRCIGELDADGRPKFETKCPICREFLKKRGEINRKYPRNSDEGKTAYLAAKDAYHPRVQNYANVLTRKGEVKVLAYGVTIQNKLLRYWFDENFKLEEDFTDPVEGRWMNVIKTSPRKRESFANYDVQPAGGELGQPCRIKNWSEKAEMRHDLTSEDVLGEKLSAEAIKLILRGLDDEDVDDDEEEESEEEDVDADEDEDTGDDDEEEESDEEDDEEEKPRKKKSKLKRPACYGDPEDHDPEDEVCQECPSFDDCAQEPAVAKLYRIRAKKAKAAKMKKRRSA